MKSASNEWAALDLHERMDAITAQIHSISTDGIAPTAAEWDNQRPPWMPKSSAVAKFFAVQFLTMALCLGYKPTAKQMVNALVESECACGRPLETYRLATVGTQSSGSRSAALIPLCGSCAELWDELEN